MHQKFLPLLFALLFAQVAYAEIQDVCYLGNNRVLVADIQKDYGYGVEPDDKQAWIKIKDLSTKQISSSIKYFGFQGYGGRGTLRPDFRFLCNSEYFFLFQSSDDRVFDIKPYINLPLEQLPQMHQVDVDWHAQKTGYIRFDSDNQGLIDTQPFFHGINYTIIEYDAPYLTSIDAISGTSQRLMKLMLTNMDSFNYRFGPNENQIRVGSGQALIIGMFGDPKKDRRVSLRIYEMNKSKVLAEVDVSKENLDGYYFSPLLFSPSQSKFGILILEK
jgi:hypothetical protein